MYSVLLHHVFYKLEIDKHKWHTVGCMLTSMHALRQTKDRVPYC